MKTIFFPDLSWSGRVWHFTIRTCLTSYCRDIFDGRKISQFPIPFCLIASTYLCFFQLVTNYGVQGRVAKMALPYFYSLVHCLVPTWIVDGKRTPTHRSNQTLAVGLPLICLEYMRPGFPEWNFLSCWLLSIKVFYEMIFLATDHWSF